MYIKHHKYLIILFLHVFLLLGSKKSLAQEFMFGYGLTFYTDIVAVQSIEKDGAFELEHFGFNYFTGSLEMKLNVYEFSNDLAIGLATSPCIGLGLLLDQDGLGNFRIPVYAQLDYGKLSTYSNFSKFGIGVGLGYQFETYNLIGDAGIISFGSVAGKVAFRFRDTLEISYKMGLPQVISVPYADDSLPSNIKYVRQERVTSCHVSFVIYPKY